MSRQSIQLENYFPSYETRSSNSNANNDFHVQNDNNSGNNAGNSSYSEQEELTDGTNSMEQSDIDINSDFVQNNTLTNRIKKKYRSEKDIPENLKFLYSTIKQYITHTEGHSIEIAGMHCKEIHKQEKGQKRWKLQCSLCNKDFRPVDYFLFHCGDKCPKYQRNEMSLISFLQPLLSPRERFLEQLAIVSASCNISSRQIASPEFKTFISFIFQTNARDIPLDYSDKDVNKSIVETYTKIKEKSMKDVSNLKLPMFIQIDGGQNGHIHSYQILLCFPSKISPFPYKSIETLHWNSGEFIKNIQQCLKELSSQNIFISAITGDNLKAQLNALNPCSQKSLQVMESKKNDKDSKIVSLIYFPCLAHTTDLALDDCVDDENFKTITKAKEDLFMFRKFFHDNQVRKTIKKSINLSICEKQWIFMIKPSISLLKK